jgi:hypothetical protein
MRFEITSFLFGIGAGVLILASACLPSHRADADEDCLGGAAGQRRGTADMVDRFDDPRHSSVREILSDLGCSCRRQTADCPRSGERSYDTKFSNDAKENDSRPLGQNVTLIPLPVLSPACR